jgi:hypothetical protein
MGLASTVPVERFTKGRQAIVTFSVYFSRSITSMPHDRFHTSQAEVIYDPFNGRSDQYQKVRLDNLVLIEFKH